MTDRANWLSIQAYADHFGLHRQTVLKYMTQGLVVYWKIGRITRIKKQAPYERRPGGPQPTS